VLKPFIDARTMSKVHVLHTKSDGSDAPSKLAPFGISGPAAEWLGQVIAMAPKPGNLPSLAPLLGASMEPVSLPHEQRRWQAAVKGEAPPGSPTK
jgi:hypothetical protein